MTNHELHHLLEMIAPADGWGAESATTTIVRELGRRELQRMNPRAEEDPCTFFGGRPDHACQWGTYGCSAQHKRSDTEEA